MKLPKTKMTFWICTANSRVGDKQSTWVSRNVVSSDCRIEIENVTVLPVPISKKNTDLIGLLLH